MKISELLRGVDAVPVNLSGEEISPGAVSEYMEREIIMPALRQPRAPQRSSSPMR